MVSSSSWVVDDHQVKLRGFRVVAGEIESVLAAPAGARGRGRRSRGSIGRPAPLGLCRAAVRAGTAFPGIPELPEGTTARVDEPEKPS